MDVFCHILRSSQGSGVSFQPAHAPPPAGFYPGPPDGAFPPPGSAFPGPHPGVVPAYATPHPWGHQPPIGAGHVPPYSAPHPSGQQHVVSVINYYYFLILPFFHSMGHLLLMRVLRIIFTAHV